ncbi:hypothetical protein DXH95_02055 [Sphingorhabdus pulchriflava]|uniref:Uncharacterized protein n=1 Tax=Sphingorhabdus pulchriflava TaxID=2292257 RepID=A0A371BFR6_9SPHN|nr:hypothetical protein [Sphingorhabdus pulchriflava]RDV06243.1 hypothetical protein DXH95_02055 [Sphingorhabdus pulchriflava]
MRKLLTFSLPFLALSTAAQAGPYITIGSEPDRAPNRSIYVADFDLITRSLDGGGDPSTMANAAMQSANPIDFIEAKTIYKINVYQVMENGGPIEKGGSTNFIQYFLAFKCRDRLVNIEEATAYDRAGRTQKSSMTEWMPVPDNWVAQAYKIACKAPEWEKAMATARQMATNFEQGKKSKKQPTDPFAPLQMQMVGSYAAITDMIDQIWGRYWPDAKQPEYENTMSPAELEKYKAQKIAELEAQSKKLGQMASDIENDLKMQDSMDRASDVAGRRFVQELQGMAGRSEEEVVATFGVPNTLNVNGNVRQLDWYWSEQTQEQVPITVDVIGGCSHGVCGAKIGETTEYQWQTVQVNCRRTLYFREGGTQPGYRLFDFRAGCD